MCGITLGFGVSVSEENPYLWGMTTEVASPKALGIEI